MRAFAVLAAGAVPATLATGDSSSSEAPMDTSFCAWPENVTKCKCRRWNSVGSCAVSLVIKNFSKVPGAFSSFAGCAAKHGPTECFVGKCLCIEGFCTSEDGTTCEPQVCVQGDTAPRFEPTGYWMSKFYGLASSDSFPPPGITKSEALDFVKDNALWPAVLVVLGLIVGLVTVACLCRNPDMGERGDLKVPRSPVRLGSKSEGSARQPKMQDEPSFLPMLSVAGFTLALNVILIIQRSATYERTTATLDRTVDHVLRDVTTVHQQAIEINHTVRDLQSRLEHAPESCLAVGDQTKQMMKERARSAMGKYCDKVENFTKQIKPLPAQVKKMKDYMHGYFPLLKWGPILPVLVMTLVNAFMVLEAFLTRVYGTSTLAREEDFAMHVASVIFFLVILLVAVISAAEVSVGIAASLFCDDVDQTILQYGAFVLNNHTNTSDANKQMMINISRFYVSGEVPNPVSRKLQTLKKYFKAAMEYYHTDLVQDNKAIPGALCPALDEFSTRADFLLPAKNATDAMLPLIQASNIYPYYDGVVHELMCGSIVETLGWTVVTQAVVGLICFPACAVLTHRFLSSWAVWKSRAEQAGEDVLGDVHEATGKFHGGDAEGFSSESDDEGHCCRFWRGGVGPHANSEDYDRRAFLSPR